MLQMLCIIISLNQFVDNTSPTTADSRTQGLIALISQTHTHIQRATNTHTILLVNDHNWIQTNSSPITLFSFLKPQQSSRKTDSFGQTFILADHLTVWSCVSKSTQHEDHFASPTTHTPSLRHMKHMPVHLSPRLFWFTHSTHCTQLISSIPPQKTSVYAPSMSGPVQ